MIIDETLRKLCDHSTHLYFLIDINNDVIVYSNPTFNHLFGSVYQPSVLMNFVHADDRQYVIQNYESCRSGSQINDFECRLSIDGVHYHYKISAVCVSSDAGQTIIGCRAENMTMLTEYIRSLADHNKKKNSILNIVAHDLIGPINSIEVLSNLLGSGREGKCDREMQEYLQMINRSSKKCINLIQNFINKEFMQSTALSLVKRRIDLVSRMRVLLNEYQSNAAILQRQFILQTNEDSVYVELDEDKFFQSINNLISNSLKFTHDQGTIRIRLEDHASWVVISITDDGIGIPEEHHKDLFQEYTPARRAGLKGEQSHGLGMSIIKTIVEWHEGKIWFESKVNKGTTFFIEIPK
ncbi:MAG: PAS domain-containing sensor histidine kinase [Pedobacter sp.]|uniref:PAS domain-containing sensor histidine kinase n=1 Tax=Pedobacter sp. TaxID=1411316 RepID=UPI003395EF6C